MTEYRTMLAVARDTSKAESLFAQSFALATRCRAHLIGMYAAAPVAVHPALRGRQLEEWMDARLREQAAASQACRKAFEAAARSVDTSSEWRGEEPAAVPDTQRALHYSRCADIAIVCKSAEGSDFMDPDLTLEDLLIGSGRPVMVLPDTAQDQQQPGQRIAIAWNGSREAARAVHDAMPLLRAAPPDSVHIICPGERPGNERLPLGVELAQSLSRHGINAQVITLEKKHLNAGPDVLTAAYGLNADLLVMGAWGHSRLREFVLGGATDTALRESSIPVFMSH